MSSPQPSLFSFKSIIENSKMKVRILFLAHGWREETKLASTPVCNQTITFTRMRKGGE